MNLPFLFANRAGRLLDHVYSACIRTAFAHCGKRTTIGRRSKLMAPHLIHLGSDVSLGEDAWLNAKDDSGRGEPTLYIGDGSYVGRFVHINAWRHVRIGRQVLIGDRVFISDADHNYVSELPVLLQGDRFIGNVTLMDGCWIGIGAAVLPGVTIGRNAVVGANSVVTRDVPDRSVVGGIPARLLKQLGPG